MANKIANIGINNNVGHIIFFFVAKRKVNSIFSFVVRVRFFKKLKLKGFLHALLNICWTFCLNGKNDSDGEFPLSFCTLL